MYLFNPRLISWRSIWHKVLCVGPFVIAAATQLA